MKLAKSFLRELLEEPLDAIAADRNLNGMLVRQGDLGVRNPDRVLVTKLHVVKGDDGIDFEST